MQNREGILIKPEQRTLASEITSLGLFGLALFSFLALLTYVPGDPSFFSNIKDNAQNACGRIGAMVSSLLLSTFGLGAFLLPILFAFIGTLLFKKEGGWVKTLSTISGMVISIFALTTFLSLQWKYWSYSNTLLLTGGNFGYWLSQILKKEFNTAGSSIVTLFLFFIALAFSTPLSISLIISKVFKFISKAAWKFIKVIFTYFSYLIGLFALRATQRLNTMFYNAISKLKNIENKTPQLPFDLPKPETPKEVVPTELSQSISVLTESQNIQETPMIEPQILPPETNPLVAKLETQEDSKEDIKENIKKQGIKTLKNFSLQKGFWKLPPIEFFKKPPKIESSIDREKLIQNSQILKQKFMDFGIDGEITAVRPGPVITLYEFRPGPGIKLSRIAALADDLSMALSAQSVRILAPWPGKSVVGIEIPGEIRETVFLREFLQHSDFFGPKYTIPIVMGKDIGGQVVLSDLARMPHLLCAGQTGSGKSVFMNALICSLFYRFTPENLRMILVDPKFIEFRAYQDVPHLLLPVVDDPKQAAIAMKWAVREMDRRYRILALMGTRNLAAFNQKIEEMGTDVVKDILISEENNDATCSHISGHISGHFSGNDWMDAFEPDEEGIPQVGKLPYIVIIIDELADLMMVARKEVELSIARIAQKARAAGIHLIAATQRPSTDVITGLIKANLPSRVSFQLASYADSKTILDRSGADRLVGQGDMLFAPPGMSQLIRLHGPYVDDEEIHKITTFLKSQGKPVYRDEILIDNDDEQWNSESDGGDELFDQAVELVKRTSHASASFLQRHLKIGYNRAARMIETMEERGIVSQADGSRPREVLLK
ncbi:MAG: DNA translocase FtsK 4TM domain-containing protein [Bdellovibrio sp.]|nr:DNA translocase FtsK 4TM domain-containing protein [Bdellovibrio sp.]